MIINQHIEKLHELAEQSSQLDVLGFHIFRRMYAIGIISYINELIQELEELNKKVDIDIEMEAVEINYDQFLNPRYWNKLELFGNNDSLYRLFDMESYYHVDEPIKEINQLVDYLPNNGSSVNFTQDQISTFKTCMIQLCDDERINETVLKYALNKGLRTITNLLFEINKKISNPKDHHYLRLWEETVETFCSEDWQKEYDEWKDEYDGVTFDQLKEKQIQEIVLFLKTTFLRYRPAPTRGDINRCQIDIQKDAFNDAYEMPEDIDEQCARFDYFVRWADEGKNILILDGKRMGKYLYRNCQQLTDEEKEAVVRLDVMLDLIHEDMAEHDLNLKPYLKRYEENMINGLIKDCALILNSCQPYLKDGLRSTFLREYLSMLLYDEDMKQEAREKLLSSKTRNKYLCQMIAALNCFYVFKADVVKADLARSLYPYFENKTNFESTLENIERFERKREGALYNWTKKIIDDLKEHPYNPFKGLF